MAALKFPLDVARVQKLLRDYLEMEGVTPQQLTDRFGIGKATLRKLLSCSEPSIKFTVRIARLLARGLGKTLDDLRFATVLPSNPEFYEGLKFSYYIDHRRDRVVREPYWRAETVSLSLRRNKVTAQGEIQLRFQIRLMNADGIEMRGFAARNTGLHFVVTVGGCNKGKIAFDAAFSRVVDGVLSGVWFGVDPSGCASVYRMLMSASPLSVGEIEAVCAATPVHPELNGSFEDM